MLPKERLATASKAFQLYIFIFYLMIRITFTKPESYSFNLGVTIRSMFVYSFIHVHSCHKVDVLTATFLGLKTIFSIFKRFDRLIRSISSKMLNLKIIFWEMGRNVWLKSLPLGNGLGSPKVKKNKLNKMNPTESLSICSS